MYDFAMMNIDVYALTADVPSQDKRKSASFVATSADLLTSESQGM